MHNSRRALQCLEPKFDFFIAIDSDGCAFDTMEIKHKECFCPQAIKYFGLQSVSKYARETWEFVNLYSRRRGVNRFPALVAVLDLLRCRTAVQNRGVQIDELPHLRDWIAVAATLDNSALRQKANQLESDELLHVLRWSDSVNAAIEDIVHGVPPFPKVVRSLRRAAESADMIVCSGTPVPALKREWAEHGLSRFVRVIAGQETGSKTEHLWLATEGRYQRDRILMIGDAAGDMKAAQNVGALFYPVVPGQEKASWERFFDEALDRFFALRYAGSYQDALIAELDVALPESPPWDFTESGGF